MKRLDLNILLKEEVLDESGKKPLPPVEVAIRWIGIMLERSINKPDPRTRQATTGANLDVHRKYFRLMDKLEKHVNGIVELEDDDFSFLDRKFHQAELPVQKDICEILVGVEDAINTSKVISKEGGKK